MADNSVLNLVSSTRSPAVLYDAEGNKIETTIANASDLLRFGQGYSSKPPTVKEVEVAKPEPAKVAEPEAEEKLKPRARGRPAAKDE